MRVRGSIPALAGLCVQLTACIVLPTVSPSPTEPAMIDGLINCAYVTPMPDQGSILLPFKPDQPCTLENIEVREDICIVNTSADLHYPCYQMERVQEIKLISNENSILIQRDYHIESGCWTMTSTDIHSLRVCERSTGESQRLAEDIRGPTISSPDSKYFPFVEPELENHRTKPHIYRISADGTAKQQLDTQPFPQEQVTGAYVESWSENGEWLHVCLSDGSKEGYNTYYLRSDDSGEFVILP